MTILMMSDVWYYRKQQQQLNNSEYTTKAFSASNLKSTLLTILVTVAFSIVVSEVCLTDI